MGLPLDLLKDHENKIGEYRVKVKMEKRGDEGCSFRSLLSVIVVDQFPGGAAVEMESVEEAAVKGDLRMDGTRAILLIGSAAGIGCQLLPLPGVFPGPLALFPGAIALDAFHIGQNGSLFQPRYLRWRFPLTSFLRHATLSRYFADYPYADGP